MITTKIKAKIVRKGRGSVFTPSDFLTVGPSASVDQALFRLAKKGVIRRLTHGIYDYPKTSPRLGALSPKPDDVVKAVARKDGINASALQKIAKHLTADDLQGLVKDSPRPRLDAACCARQLAALAT